MSDAAPASIPRRRGGRPPRPPEEARTAAVWAYVEPGLANAVMHAASREGVSVSWFVRGLLLRAVSRPPEVSHNEKPSRG